MSRLSSPKSRLLHHPINAATRRDAAADALQDRSNTSMVIRSAPRHRVLVHATSLCLAISARIVSGQTAAPSPQPAIEYVIGAFDRYPLVALSEWHGSRETKNFVGALIRHPGFSGKVADIVVEFGNARYQRMVDRYIAGEHVAREELKQVWENTTIISGVWSSPIYEEFFADVRAFNQTVSPAGRVRVLLGDPPIDWNAVTSPADEDMNDWRDAHFAWVVEREVMRKGHKALLFIGGAHISRKVILPNSLIHLLDARFPRKTLVVSALQIPNVTRDLASRIRGWPVPSAAEVRDTWLGFVDVRDVGFALSEGHLQDDIDVVLYLGAEPFSNVPAHVDPNSPFAVELKRRQNLQDETLPFRGGEIRFNHGSASFTQESESALQSVLVELQRDDNLVLLVKAYADSTEANAQQLSESRARFVVKWLVRHGVASQRLATQGCGSSRPLWISDSWQRRSLNRRAELVRQSTLAGCQPPRSFDWEKAAKR